MEKKDTSIPRRQLLTAAAVAGGLPLLNAAYTSVAAAAAPATGSGPVASMGSGPVRIAVLDDFMDVGAKLDWSAVTKRATIDFYNDHFDDQAVLARQMAPYEIIAVGRHGQVFAAETTAKLPKLKMLVNTGGLTDQYDLKQLEKQKVIVTIGGPAAPPVPGAPVAPRPVQGGVEEIAFALLIDCARQITASNVDMKANRHWQYRASPSFAGKTLGLLGLGLTGGKMVQFAKAFRVNTQAWSLNLTDEQAAAAGSKRVSLDELLATSDFISVHYRLGERSRHLIGAEHFAKMKPTAYLINTSRGEILRENELIAALQKKQLAGAGLDVFAEEPLAKDHPFRKMENVVMTPHIGYVTTEYLQSAYRTTMENIIAFMDGKPIRIQPYSTVNID